MDGYLAELRNRGVEHVFVVACDGRRAPGAIAEIWVGHRVRVLVVIAAGDSL